MLKKGRVSALYLADRPPPVVALAQQLLADLLALKQCGSYPPTLAALAGPNDGTLLEQAMLQPQFADRAAWLKPKNRAAPVLLKEDLTDPATGGGLLPFLLGSARTEQTQAFTAKELAKSVAKPFVTVIAAGLEAAEAASLPESVGFVLIKRKRHFFALTDMRTNPPASNFRAAAGPVESGRFAPSADSSPAAPTPPRENAPHFAIAFAAAFDRLDRARGQLNFVSLVDLRRELALCSRSEFDAHLLELRRARQYTLKAAEGLDGLTPDELAAGIREDGDLLLNVSRIRP